MTKKMKRVLSLIMALVMLLCCSGVAFAADTAAHEDAISAREQAARYQLLTGQEAELADVIEIAMEYAGANLWETGITADVEENGCLQITQFGGPNMAACSGTLQEIVCTSLMLTDAEGRIVDANSVLDEAYAGPTDSIDVFAYRISATHTAYFAANMNGLGSYMAFQLTRMVTSVKDAGLAGTTLVQVYQAARDGVSSPAYSRTSTIYPASYSDYTWHNTVDNNWYTPTSGSPGGYIYTFAVFECNGQSFTMRSGIEFDNFEDYIRPLSGVAEQE